MFINEAPSLNFFIGKILSNNLVTHDYHKTEGKVNGTLMRRSLTVSRLEMFCRAFSIPDRAVIPILVFPLISLSINTLHGALSLCRVLLSLNSICLVLSSPSCVPGSRSVYCYNAVDYTRPKNSPKIVARALGMRT